MKQLQPEKEILMSWRRCMDKGVSIKATEPALIVQDELLELKQKENSLLIYIFNDCSSNINVSITNKHPIFLVNTEGILLKVFNEKLMKKSIPIAEGTVFTEESSGTNAIAMSMILKKSVYTLPNYHYCEFLRNLHLYSIPLFVNKEAVGYLAMVISAHQVTNEMITISELLGYKIANEFRTRSNLASVHVDSSFKLSQKQLAVLRLLAKGATDKSIAIDMQISFTTVRYHKKNIFKKLNVSCSLEAVIKALKLNLILLDEIFF